jgi:glycosyltransferase involved in cell wall biosynthesis
VAARPQPGSSSRPIEGPLNLVVYSDAPLIGGAEHSLATLLRHLDSRFQVEAVTTDADVGRFLADARDGTTHRTVPAVSGKGDIGPLFAQLGAVRRSRPDLVHVNLRWIWTGQYGILAGLLAPGAGTIAVEHAQPDATRSRAQRFLRRQLCQRLDAHVAVGERSARSVESHIGLGPGSVLTIHNGVEETEALPARSAGAAPTIGAIGRLSAEKGFADLPHVLTQLPEARVVLVGDGPERERLAELAASLGVGDRFELVGWQASPREWLAQFDLLAVPSRMEGSPPLVALEAMMAGVPVVAADVGAVAEAIGPDVGALVPPGDPRALATAIGRLLSDHAQLARRGEQGRRLALQSFSAPLMAARFEALYEDVLSRRRGAAPEPGA